MFPWFRWWIMMVLISIGSFILYWTGFAIHVWENDVTKLTYVIYVLFVFFSTRIGIKTYKTCKYNKVYETDKIVEWSDRFPVLGIIGTVIGLSYLFGTADFGSADTTALAKTIGIGTGTALYTTMSGLICRLLLDLQITNIPRCDTCSHSDEGTLIT